MARARSNGGAYAWALVVFGCGFVVALLVAIIFYTKIKQAEDGELAAQQKLRTYLNEAQDSADIQPYLASGSGSAFRAMKNEIVELRSNIDFLNNRNDLLKQQVTEAEATIEREQGTIEQRQAELERAQTRAEATLQEAVDRARQLEGELAKLSQERNALSETLTATMTDSQGTAQRRIDELNASLSDVTDELAEVSSLRDELAGENARLVELLRDRIEVPDVTTADGEVLSVFNNGGQLFINRGRRQGVMLGLTFEVFEANEVIRLSNAGSARGKATIEVYELREDTAACRVVRRSRGAQVIQGDVIANIVYDPTKEFTFYAFGNFDIENDGGPSDIARIENLVTEWGGNVAELQNDEDGLPILSPEIDFLILGNEPQFPDDLDPDELDPEVIGEWQVQVRAFETYQALLGDAKTLRIPVLNQNRFLDLVGYYVR